MENNQWTEVPLYVQAGCLSLLCLVPISVAVLISILKDPGSSGYNGGESVSSSNSQELDIGQPRRGDAPSQTEGKNTNVSYGVISSKDTSNMDRTN